MQQEVESVTQDRAISEISNEPEESQLIGTQEQSYFLVFKIISLKHKVRGFGGGSDLCLY